MTVYREDMDGAKCDTPGCKCLSGPVYLDAACHRPAGLVGAYFRQTGTLELRCRQCGKVAAVFAIASRLPPGRN